MLELSVRCRNPESWSLRRRKADKGDSFYFSAILVFRHQHCDTCLEQQRTHLLQMPKLRKARKARPECSLLALQSSILAAYINLPGSQAGYTGGLLLREVPGEPCWSNRREKYAPLVVHNDQTTANSIMNECWTRLHVSFPNTQHHHEEDTAPDVGILLHENVVGKAPSRQRLRVDFEPAAKYSVVLDAIVTAHCRILMTSTGLTSDVHAKSRKGYHIGLLQGCNMPTVLRKVGTFSALYKMPGYLESAMATLALLTI